MNNTTKDTLKVFNSSIQKTLEELDNLEAWTRHGHPLVKFWKQNTEFNTAYDILTAASGSISHEVTKFSLVCSKNPTGEESAGVCKVLLEPCEKLVTAARVSLHCGAGNLLSKDILHHTRCLLKGVLDLGKLLEENIVVGSRDFSPYTGRIWDLAKAMSTIPKSNYIAIKRRLLEGTRIVVDTKEEFTQLLNDSENHCYNNECLEIDEEEDDDFDFSKEMEEEDKPRLMLFLRILDMICAIFKRSITSLNSIQSNNDEMDQEILWGSNLHLHFNRINEIVIDISPCFYPPHDVSQINDKLDQLKEIVSNGLNYLEEAPHIAEEEKMVLCTGRQRFQDRIREMRSLLTP